MWLIDNVKSFILNAKTSNNISCWDVSYFFSEHSHIYTNHLKLISDRNYVGFSITAGHPTRIKEINFDEIIKVANYYSDKLIPTFFIENKFQELIAKIKQKVKKAYFPEDQSSAEFKKPMLVTALGSLTKFNITIDNGISHMLSFSNNKKF